MTPLKKSAAALAILIPTTFAALPAASLPAASLPAASLAAANAPLQQSGSATGKEAAAGAREQKLPSPTDVLVTVNGSTITRLDLDRAMKVLLAQNPAAGAIDAKSLKQAQEAALEQLVDAELLYQEALRKRIPDLERKVDQKVAQNRQKFASDEAFQQALEGVDLDLEGFRTLARKDIAIATFIQEEFAGKTVVTETEAHAFYTENRERYFSREENVHASHILVGVERTASAEEHKKAKEKAAALLKKVREGGDFAALAKAESSCPSSAEGGELGSFGRGKMVPEFDKAAFALKPGEVSDIVETDFGYHIIKVTAREEKKVQPFEEVKARITEYLMRDGAQKALSGFVEVVKGKAKIEKGEAI